MGLHQRRGFRGIFLVRLMEKWCGAPLSLSFFIHGASDLNFRGQVVFPKILQACAYVFAMFSSVRCQKTERKKNKKLLPFAPIFPQKCDRSRQENNTYDFSKKKKVWENTSRRSRRWRLENKTAFLSKRAHVHTLACKEKKKLLQSMCPAMHSAMGVEFRRSHL